MHDISLITTIAFGLTAALVFGLLAKRLGLSTIVGYLIAGVLVGPYTPGFVGDVGLALQLAEIGVILLMFGVGLHFHLSDLMAVRSIAIPGALGQSAAATVCGLGVALLVGWSWNAGLVLGISISVASTVVLIRILMDAGLVDTTEGRVAVRLRNATFAQDLKRTFDCGTRFRALSRLSRLCRLERFRRRGKGTTRRPRQHIDPRAFCLRSLRPRRFLSAGRAFGFRLAAWSFDSEYVGLRFVPR